MGRYALGRGEGRMPLIRELELIKGQLAPRWANLLVESIKDVEELQAKLDKAKSIAIALDLYISQLKVDPTFESNNYHKMIKIKAALEAIRGE